MKANRKSAIGNQKPVLRETEGSEISNAVWLTLALTLAVSGWGGLYYLVMQVHPTAWARLVFLGLWSIALAGTAWPALLAINQRWGHHVTPLRIWRQSGWVALLGTLLAWLQMNRALTLSVAAAIAGIFGIIEAVLVLREREAKREETHEDK